MIAKPIMDVDEEPLLEVHADLDSEIGREHDDRDSHARGPTDGSPPKPAREPLLKVMTDD